MKRFFFDKSQQIDGAAGLVRLSEEESRHLCRVLRLRQGQEVELCDGDGTVYRAVILAAEKTVTLQLLEILGDMRGKQRTPLVVCQGLIKLKNMEVIAQKCTELGIDTLVPFQGTRSQGNLVQQFHGKEERFSRIIDEACKQCRRTVPMALGSLVSFAEVLRAGQERGDLLLFFWEKEGEQNLLSSLTDDIGNAQAVTLIFGPEGGFSEQEVEMARDAGCRLVGLGSLILRAETAVLAASAIVQHLLGCI